MILPARGIRLRAWASRAEGPSSAFLRRIDNAQRGGLELTKFLNLGVLPCEASTLTSVLRLKGKAYRQGRAVRYTKLLCVLLSRTA